MLDYFLVQKKNFSDKVLTPNATPDPTPKPTLVLYT